jgi:type I restriction enzyme M protein
VVKLEVNVPSELKGFHSIFEKLAYSYDWSVIFDDFLEYIILFHNMDTSLKWSKKYSKDEIKLFWELYREWIKVMDQQLVDDKDWYDLFGIYYEAVIVSKMNRTYQGQFFTPPNVCNMMADMTIAAANLRPGQSVNDPCCGSGRNLLAANTIIKGCYHVGMDLDQTCVFMTIANFLLHGIEGEVIWTNTLTQEFYGAWKVNEYLNKGIPLPHVRKAQISELYSYKVPIEVKTEIVEKVVTLDSFMEVSK